MSMSIPQLLHAIQPRSIASEVTMAIDRKAMHSPMDFEKLGTFNGYLEELGRHYKYVYGQPLSDAEAEGRAERILDREYHDRGGNIVSAYQDAVEATNGGFLAHRQMITEAIKGEATEFYVQATFSRFFDRSSWEARVEAVRAFIAYCGHDLAGLVDPDKPERHAHDFQELVRAYVAALHRNAARFRRL